ncbi:hypothetical protein [Salarchaeum japonicum]|uniref:hypothetical protein n=1 Tax=Salarchaeum japonicum TaxID=555573 RepID=UPI003C755515
MAVNERQARAASIDEEETILGNVEPGWGSWWPWLLLGIVLLPVLVGIVVLYLTYRAKQKSGSVITEDRIVQTHATPLHTRSDEVPLSSIRSISTISYLFGGGYVEVHTGGVNINVYSRSIKQVADTVREATRNH